MVAAATESSAFAQLVCMREGATLTLNGEPRYGAALAFIADAARGGVAFRHTQLPGCDIYERVARAARRLAPAPLYVNVCADHNDHGGGAERRRPDPGDGGRIVPICDLGDSEAAAVRGQTDLLSSASTRLSTLSLPGRCVPRWRRCRCGGTLCPLLCPKSRECPVRACSALQMSERIPGNPHLSQDCLS